MRNRQLRTLLLSFAEEAAECLGAQTAAGEEIPFEVAAQSDAGVWGLRSGRTPLYCYRPLTGTFIAERRAPLSASVGYAPALRELEQLEGLDTYLEARGRPPVPGGPRAHAEEALIAFLGATFGETTEFEVVRERFDRAYAELEAHSYAGRRRVTVLAPVIGVEIESDEVDLGDGLKLARVDALEDPPPEAAWSTGAPGAEVSTVAVYAEEAQDAARVSAGPARAQLSRLLTALRLFEPGSTSLGPVAWARSDDGPWRIVPLGCATNAERPWLLTAPREREMHAFFELVSRRTPQGGEVAWALARFEMGLERAAPLEALTDHLLALRALLEPEGPAHDLLSARLAALCAAPEEQAELAARMAEAVALERSAPSGCTPLKADAEELVDEVSGFTRALLRDIICGHLEPDVGALADELLAESAGARLP